jgi:hypothetical protein
VPAHLRSLLFFKLARSRLARGGALFANIYVKNAADRTHERTADKMKKVWRDVRLLDSPGLDRNIVVMAGNVGKLQKPVLLEPPAVDAEVMRAELAAMAFCDWLG